jgi:hypothetical protein
MTLRTLFLLIKKMQCVKGFQSQFTIDEIAVRKTASV